MKTRFHVTLLSALIGGLTLPLAQAVFADGTRTAGTKMVSHGPGPKVDPALVATHLKVSRGRESQDLIAPKVATIKPHASRAPHSILVAHDARH